MTTITVAASQHLIQAPDNWEQFVAIVETQVRDAVQQGATLLVFPEYGSLSLVMLLPPAHRLTLKGQLSGLQAFATDYVSLFESLARQFSVWIVAPSFPFAIESGHCVNRAWITGPAGEVLYQDKIHMTRFENELFAISPGTALTIVDTGTFRFATAICYDSEFPALVKQQIDGGAQLITVPSCTDSLAGYHRVLYCARARAVENQCFVVQAPLCGEAPWCEAIDINVGFAGVFSPVDRGFPADGTLALGTATDNWVTAHCDLTMMTNVREDGQVFNWRDQQQPCVLPVRIDGGG